MPIKTLTKKRKTLINKDERLATICMYLIKAYFKIEDSQLITRAIENKNWKMSELVDKALMAISVKEFISVVHSHAPDFYKVERVNIYMWDHRRQEIYQIIEDKEGTDALIFFSSQSGIAGKVSNEGKSFIANRIQEHHQFLQEIDDPKGKYHPVTGVPIKGEINILSIPIFWYNELMEPAFKYYPLWVIQLINKTNDLPFTEEDQKNSEKWSQFLGKILSFIIREDERKWINEKKRMSKVILNSQ